MVPPPRAVKGTTPTAGLRGMVSSRRFDTVISQRNCSLRKRGPGYERNTEEAAGT